MRHLELLNGERQVAPTVEGIRRDHRARYEWVASRFNGSRPVIVDAACGVGYGSAILAQAGADVLAFDRSEAAVGYARAHYNHDPRITYFRGDAYTVDDLGPANAVCAFEILEHLAKPGIALRRWAKMAKRLYVSVPNEDGFAFGGKILHHVRHYTRTEFADLLSANGWQVTEWWSQDGTDSVPERVVGRLASTKPVESRTLLAVCDRVEVLDPEPEPDPDAELDRHLIRGKRPKSVAIVAMGDSSGAWTSAASRAGGRWSVCDEVWVINNLGGVLAHDRVFHMDDLAIQESRVEAQESSALAGMLQWMPHHPLVYSSRAYARYPGVREYPLEWVLNRVKVDHYFTGTVSYAVAFAIALGVESIHVYGADFHYENPVKREQGRACVEFWLGVAEAKGITVHVPANTTLFDSRWGGRDVLYGYDTEWVRVEHSGRYRVSRIPRKPEEVPTASEIAARYSHNPSLDGR